MLHNLQKEVVLSLVSEMNEIMIVCTYDNIYSDTGIDIQMTHTVLQFYIIPSVFRKRD